MRRTMWTVFGVATIAAMTACGNGSPATPSPTAAASPVVTQTATPTPTQSVEAQVSAAYLAYWEAYSRAVLELDVNLVRPLISGEELQRLTDEIEQLRKDGVALRIVVKHDFAIVETTSRRVTIVDQVVNDSFYVDPITKNPPQAEGRGERIRYTFFLDLDDRLRLLDEELRVDLELREASAGDEDAVDGAASELCAVLERREDVREREGAVIDQRRVVRRDLSDAGAATRRIQDALLPGHVGARYGRSTRELSGRLGDHRLRIEVDAVRGAVLDPIPERAEVLAQEHLLRSHIGMCQKC